MGAAPSTSGPKLGSSGMMLGLAKLWFLVAAYAITVGLTHLVPPAEYGRYYVVARIIAVPNLVLVYTLLFAVSRPMAAEYDQGFPSYFALRARGRRIALTFGGAASVAFALAAPGLGGLLRDPEIVGPLWAVAPISCVYALYAVNLGTLNALRRFPLQASLDIFMATAKAALILGAAAIGASLTVTVAGFTAASVLSLLLSLVLIARARPAGLARDPSRAAPPMARFAGALVLFTACVNLLQSVDVLILKRFVADDLVGFYSSAQQVALVPLSLMNAMSLLLFPLVASLEQTADREQVAAYITKAAAVATLLLALMASVGAAAAPQIQALLFPSAYGAAAAELRLLVWGFSGYSFAITMAWVFNSTQRTRVALALVLLPLLVVSGLALALVPTHGTTGAAWSVLLAGAVAFALTVVALARFFGARISPLHLAKIAAAVAAVELVAFAWPQVSTAGLWGKLGIVLRLVALTVSFVGVVLVTRALTVADLRGLRRAA